jgi:hypothetical protein
MKDMSLKDEADITKLLKDKRRIWSELKAYCSQQVLQAAKTSIQHELTEQGKEALADVSPDNEVSIVFPFVWSFGYIVWFQQGKASSKLIHSSSNRTTSVL